MTKLSTSSSSSAFTFYQHSHHCTYCDRRLSLCLRLLDGVKMLVRRYCPFSFLPKAGVIFLIQTALRCLNLHVFSLLLPQGSRHLPLSQFISKLSSRLLSSDFLRDFKKHLSRLQIIASTNDRYCVLTRHKQSLSHIQNHE